MVFNILETSCPHFRKLFVFVRGSHPISTTSSISDLKVQSIKTEQAKSKISHSGASLFNSLPSDLIDIQKNSICSYKKKLNKKYFLQLNYIIKNKFSVLNVSILYIVNVTLNEIFH